MSTVRGILTTGVATLALAASSAPALSGPAHSGPAHSGSAHSGPARGGPAAGPDDGGVGATGVFGAGARTYDAAHVPPGAKISVWATYPGRRRTVVTLRVTGLLPRHEYGAHAHQLPCGPLPTDAGGHFQHVVDPVQPSVDPAYANPRNEIWLDFTTDKHGNGSARSVVGWQFGDARAASVVVHEHHTATAPGAAGTAGARYGCLTVPF